MGASVQARGPSRTAVLTAVARAVHRQERPPWVIDDFLAAGLAGQDGMALEERLRAELPRAYLLAFSRMGQPFVTRFLPVEIAQLLHQHGFGELTDFGPEQARAAYFQGHTDLDIAGAQRLIAATVMPPHPPDQSVLLLALLLAVPGLV